MIRREGYSQDAKWQKLIDGMKQAQDRLDIAAKDRKNAIEAGKKPRPKAPKSLDYRHSLEEGLLYHNLRNGEKKLCIPTNCVVDLLEMVHDSKHHFGEARMSQGLEGFTIHNVGNGNCKRRRP